MTEDVLPSNNIVSEEEYKGLSRLKKGYFYEMNVQSILDKLGVQYCGNHRQYEEWKKTTNTGYDIKLKTPKGVWLKIECKFTLKRIYHSWFKRDWLYKSADVIVTNNPLNVSYRDRRLLKQKGKKLLSTIQFDTFVQKLMKRGNKRSLNKCSDIKNATVNSSLIDVRGMLRRVKAYVVSIFRHLKQFIDKYEISFLTDTTGRLPGCQITKPKEALDTWLSYEGENTKANDRSTKEPAVFGCDNCKKRNYCDILTELEFLEGIKPKRELSQTRIDAPIVKPNSDGTDFKRRRKEWLMKHGELFIKQDSCLSRRIFLQTNKDYSLFDTGINQSSEAKEVLVEAEGMT